MSAVAAMPRASAATEPFICEDIRVDTLFLATAHVILRSGHITPTECTNIQLALMGFNDADRSGPYALMIAAAEIAITRPNLPQAVAALNAARALTMTLLMEAAK